VRHCTEDVVVQRFTDMEAGAKRKAIDAAIGELNGRENLTWSKLKTSSTGYIDDAQVHKYTLGNNYAWNPGEPTVFGGALNFKGIGIGLNRNASEFLNRQYGNNYHKQVII